MSNAPDELDILIPAYREADRIVATIAAIRAAVPGYVVVVDDGSGDDTAEVARRAGADVVISLPENRGKGAALNAALAASQAPLLLLLDADLGDSAACVAPLARAVRDGACDMAIAAFPRDSRRSGVGFVQAMARWGIHLRYGRRFTSPISGQRCLRRETLERLGGFAPGFGVEVALTRGVLDLGGVVMEIPLPLVHRRTGRTLPGFFHRARQGRDILHALLRRSASPSSEGRRAGEPCHHPPGEARRKPPFSSARVVDGEPDA